MQNFVKIAGLAAAALLTLTAAGSAADLRRAAAPAPIAVAPPPPPLAYNWTGVYLGLEGGWAWGNTEHDFTTGVGPGGRFDIDGGLIGGTLGANWQAPGSMFVLGVEGDVSWANIKGEFSALGCNSGPCYTEVNWLGTARARAGIAMNAFLLYATGGVAFGGVEGGINSNLNQNGSNTRVGWTVGGGAEVGLTRNVSVKVEYLYVDLGNDHQYTTTALGIPTNVDVVANVVRGGINVRY